jgi:hypothetical protein
MHEFFSGMLNLFGMFVDPIGGKRFQGVYVCWQIVNDPRRQLGARVGENVIRFIEKGLSVPGIALEESEYPEGYQNEESDSEDCQGG